MYLVLIIFIVLIPKYSFAYLDPGLGSYIFQMLIAGFLGVAFTFKFYLFKIKSFFSSFFSKKKIKRDKSNDR